VRARAAGAVAVAIVITSCPRAPDTPEAPVREVLARAEAAAEAKDAAVLKALIADDYRDGLGQDKRALVGLLVYTFMRHDAIHLLTRVGSITFPQPPRAEVVAFVAMAGQQIPDVGLLAGLRADLYRFDFALIDLGGGNWKVTRAGWHPATVDDFQ
jgi:hypothetical protein